MTSGRKGHYHQEPTQPRSIPEHHTETTSDASIRAQVLQDRTASRDMKGTRRSFELDLLDWSIDKDLTQDCVPVPDAFADRNASELGVESSKPNIAYGFEPAALT